MSKNNRVFVIFFSILLFLTVGMSEKAYAEQISETVHNELVGTFEEVCYAFKYDIQTTHQIKRRN